MTTFWCQYAHLPTKVQWGVRITVDGGRITGLEERAAARSGDVRCRGVTLPGFANGHSHAFHRALRGRTHAGGGTFWTWRDEMYAVAQRLDPDSYLTLARAVFLEMLVAGFTLVGEFHYLHHRAGGRPHGDPNAMGRALVRAAQEVGIRLTLLDTCYLHGGLGPDGLVPLDPVQERFSDGSVTAWYERTRDLGAGELWRAGAAVHSIRALTPAELAELGRLPLDRPLHAHVSEQPAENLAAQAFFGRTPMEILGDAGLLGEHFTAVHATHLTEQDLALLEGSGGTACICPTTERDLADGIGPTTALRQRGVPMCIGSDQHAVIDPFEELRALEMHERLMSHERGRFAPDHLRDIGSARGYAALGWPGGGRLEVGALADFVTIREDSRRTAGADRGQLVYAAGADDVTDVVVGGRHLVTDGRHALGDVDTIVHAALTEILEDR